MDIDRKGNRQKVQLSYGTKSLTVLSNIIKYVYLTLENNKLDMLANLKKFVSQMEHTTQQVTGTVNIVLPPKDELHDEVAANKRDLVENYETLLVNILFFWELFFSKGELEGYY